MKKLLVGSLAISLALLALYYETIQRRFHQEIDLIVWTSGVNNLFMLVRFGLVHLRGGDFSRESSIFPKLDETSDSLRLLVIEPGHGRIRCRSEARRFDQNPQYRALSYEWGSPESMKILHVNGMMIRVRSNLWWALYHLRDPLDETVVWVDAICINQSDRDEIGRFVPQMDMIYSRAEHVVVWLGQTEFPDDIDCRILTAWQSTPRYANGYGYNEWSGHLIPYLYEMAHGSYWQRTWVIQEMVMAADISVWYGRCSLPWSSFLLAIQDYHKSLWHDAFNPHIGAIQSFREKRIRGDILTLVELVSTFQDSFSQMPQDKLYAFLGMACDDAARFLPVSYDRPIREVYSDVISYLSNSTFESNLSDFRIVHRTALIRWILLRETGWMRQDLKRSKLVKQHDDIYGIYETPVNHNLYSRTKVMGRSANLEQQESSRLDYKDALCWLPSEPEHITKWTIEGERRSLVRAKGMLIGTIEHFGPSVNSYLASHKVARDWKTKLARRDESYGTNLLANGERLMTVLRRTSIDGSIEAIQAFRTCVNGQLEVLDKNKSARLFITDNGALGLASPQARVGDNIVQFWKSTASAIVRSYGEQHRVVGRCAFVKKGHALEWDVEDDLELFQSLPVSVEIEIDTLTRLNLNSVDMTKRDAMHPCRKIVAGTRPPSILNQHMPHDWCIRVLALPVKAAVHAVRSLYSTTITGFGILVAALLFIGQLHDLGLSEMTPRDWVLYFTQEFRRLGLMRLIGDIFHRLQARLQYREGMVAR